MSWIACEPVAGGDAGQRQRRDRRGVQLVELLDRRRRGVGRDRHHRATAAPSRRSALRTKNSPSCSGLSRNSRGTCGDDVVAVRSRGRTRRSSRRRPAAPSVAPISLIGTLSAAARSRSMVTVDLRRVEGERVLHDDEAAGGLRLVLDLLGDLEDPLRRRRIDWMTTVIGRPPPEPGSVGGAKTKASTPATLPSRPWMSCWSSPATALALGPVLEHPDDEAAVGRAAEAGDRELGRRPRDVRGQLARSGRCRAWCSPSVA